MTPGKSGPSGEHNLERRLAGYASMSIAIAAAAVAPSANAGIVETLVNPNLTTPVGGGIVFNVVGGTASTVPDLAGGSLAAGSASGNFAILNSVVSSAKRDFFIASGGNEFAVAPNGVTNFSSRALSSVARIAPNTAVGSALNFRNSFGAQMLADNSFGSLAPGDWKTLGSDYVGLEFDLSGNPYYGWAHITINPDYTITLDSFAYNNVSGAALETATEGTPEPNSLLLLVMGAAGIAGYRRKLARQTSCRAPKPAV